MLIVSVSRSVLLLEGVQGLVLEGVSSSKAQGLLELPVVRLGKRDVGRVWGLDEGGRRAGSWVGSVTSNETFPTFSDDVGVASSEKKGRRGGQKLGRRKEGAGRRSASDSQDKRALTCLVQRGRCRGKESI